MPAKSKKSSKGEGKRTARTSALSLKKDRHSISSKDKRSASVVNDDDFNSRFTKFCAQFNPSVIPWIEIIRVEPLPGNFPPMSPFNSEVTLPPNAEAKKTSSSPALQLPIPTVFLIFDDFVQQTMLNTAIIKDFKVDRTILIILRKTFQLFGTLRTLKLEYCKLENTDLRTLKTILIYNQCIEELSINGNPNPYQNFYILLKDTRLEKLSMRLCQINDRGVMLIARELTEAFKQSLLFLNMSSNFISDEGAIGIAKALRVNRVLLTLNLADNWLTDVGCQEVIGALQRFPLQHDEIVLRRRRIMDFLLRKKALILAYKEKLLRELETSSLRSGSLLSARKSSKDSAGKQAKESRKSSKGRSSAGSMSQRRSSMEMTDSMIECKIEEQMEKDRHPFVKDSSPQDMEIYCKGNFKLMHLNLAYNKITNKGVEEIADMLRYQQIYCEITEGLYHMTLEGNPIDETNHEISCINLLIEQIHTRKISVSSADSKSSKRKRSGASRNSVL